MNAALAIFVKTPGYSPIKTRLAASIGQPRAEQFHRLAAAAVAAVARAAMPRVQPYWAVAEGEALVDPLWNGLPCVWQGEGGLGARLNHICEQLQLRHGRVLLIGADAPQITVSLLHAALDALNDDSTPFVMGRAQDGGFWLFGTRQAVPVRVWMAPHYSSCDTASTLVDALPPEGGIASLPLLHDVDDGGDVAALAASLQALHHPLPEQHKLLTWLLHEGLERAMNITPHNPHASLPGAAL